nr:hypothetical protein GCM10020063_047720 [Dactylosporangium thailandense]
MKRFGGVGLTPVVVLFSLKILDEMNGTAFSVLTPEIKREFGLSISGVTSLFGAGAAVGFFGGLWIGWLADRRSRLAIALTGAALCAGFTLLTGLAGGITLLAVARLGAGLGKTVNDPTHRSLLSDYYAPDDRGKVLGLYLSAATVAGILVPLLAGGLGYVFGWRSVFVIMSVPLVVCVALAARLLREPIRGRFERIAAGGSGEVLDVEERPVSLREAWRVMRRIPTLRTLLHCVPFVTVSFAGLLTLLSIQYSERYGFNEAQLGFLISGASVANVFGLVLIGKWVGQDPRRVYSSFRLAIPPLAVGYLVMGFAPNVSVNLIGVLIIMVFAAPLLIGPALVVALVTPPALRASGFAIATFYELPAFFIIVGIGALADTAGFAVAFASMIVPLAIGAVIFHRGARTVLADMAAMQKTTLEHSEQRLVEQEPAS